MTETTVIETPAARKPKRRKARRAPRQKRIDVVAATTNTVPDELIGLTPNECPVDCRPGRCVVSGNFYCGHPRKGGLQGAELGDPAAVDRLNHAKKALAHMAVEKRRD